MVVESTDVVSPLQQSQMVRVFRLQRVDQKFELGKAAQTSEARIFQEKRPTGESGADAPLKPLKCSFASSCQGEGTGDLMISMVRMPKGFWTRTGPGYTVDGRFCVPHQSVEQAL